MTPMQWTSCMYFYICLTPFYFQIENRDFYICALFFRLYCTDYLLFLSLHNMELNIIATKSIFKYYFWLQIFIKNQQDYFKIKKLICNKVFVDNGALNPLDRKIVTSNHFWLRNHDIMKLQQKKKYANEFLSGQPSVKRVSFDMQRTWLLSN